MRAIEVEADVAVEPEVAYEYLLDFTNYAEFCRYVSEVVVEANHADTERNAPAGPGSRYRIRFGWWRLSVTLRAEISRVDRPRTIEWRILSDVDAHGRWEVEPIEPGDRSHLRFFATYDSVALSRSNLDLPRFVPMATVIERLMPLMKEAGRDVFEQIVWDLEGSKRSVEVSVRTGEGTRNSHSG